MDPKAFPLRGKVPAQPADEGKAPKKQEEREHMDRLEQVHALRNDPKIHYNCCQSVLIPYAPECGLDRAQAQRLGEHFGGGMRHGGTCGAVTGALMVLGLAGRDDPAAKALLKAFKDKNGCLECAALLKKAAETGENRKCHCDRMVDEAVELVEEALKEN